MTHPFGDTPPNGDFARYVDQLMRDAERRVHHPPPTARPPVPGAKAARSAVATASPGTAAPAPAPLPVQPSRKGASFWLAARRFFVLWLLLQFIGALYPPLRPWGTPLVLLALAGWWGLRRLQQRGGLAGMFSTPQWRDLMKQYDAQNPSAAQRGRRK